jgi:DNA-binding LacI/PurR family transcriptional regulator
LTTENVGPAADVTGAVVTHGDRRPTIDDVAEAAGVSKTSVSFAYNAPERLRPETLMRIRRVAAGLGYRPRPYTRTVGRRRRHGTIALLAPHALGTMFANPNFGEFAAGALTSAEAAGYSVHFVSPLHGSLAHALDRANVTGVVAIGLRGDGPDIDEIRRSDLPFVAVDSDPAIEGATVTIDDEAGAYAAARHLLDQGHRSFLVMSLGPFPSPTGDPWSVRARRMAGYSSALAEAGIVLADREVEMAPASVEGGAEAFDRAWAAGLRPTAVLAMSDAMAVGVLSAAGRLRVRVPADLSVVGFDDIELAQYTDPPLTTVHQPTRLKGEEAIRLLLDGPGRRDDGRGARRLLETRLVIRGSTRSPVASATARGGRRRAGRGGPADADPIGMGARVTEESMQQT